MKHVFRLLQPRPSLSTFPRRRLSTFPYTLFKRNASQWDGSTLVPFHLYEIPVSAVGEIVGNGPISYNLDGFPRFEHYEQYEEALRTESHKSPEVIRRLMKQLLLATKTLRMRKANPEPAIDTEKDNKLDPPETEMGPFRTQIQMQPTSDELLNTKIFAPVVTQSPRNRLAYVKREENLALLQYEALMTFGGVASSPLLLGQKNRIVNTWKFEKAKKIFQHVAEPDLIAYNTALNDFVSLLSEVRATKQAVGARPFLGQIVGEAFAVTLLGERNQALKEQWTRALPFIVAAELHVGLVFIQFRRSDIRRIMEGLAPRSDQAVYRICNVVTGVPGGVTWSSEHIHTVATLYRLAGKFSTFTHMGANSMFRTLIEQSGDDTPKLLFDGQIDFK